MSRGTCLLRKYPYKVQHSDLEKQTKSVMALALKQVGEGRSLTADAHKAISSPSNHRIPVLISFSWHWDNEITHITLVVSGLQ